MHMHFFPESAAFASAGGVVASAGRATAVGCEGTRPVLLLLVLHSRLLETCFMLILMRCELRAPHVLCVEILASDGVSSLRHVLSWSS